MPKCGQINIFYSILFYSWRDCEKWAEEELGLVEGVD